ncbi:MAG TPA: glycerophosphodiester phosphodiesterase family protein [Candidatus Bathyarchaeia archaeon]|nr:glycerophosphodiester phosphodiesterase family protein [Candidatus Bathyarchaeia archaeon]
MAVSSAIQKFTTEIPFHRGIMNEQLLIPVGHRGGDGDIENTIGALAAAHAAGFLFAEVDITSTKDLVPVLFHGNSDTRKVIRKLNYDELNKRKVYKRIGFSGSSKKNPIPRLVDALDTFPDLRFFLDLKDDLVSEPVAEVIKDLKAYGQVSIDGDSWKRTRNTYNALPKHLRSDVALTIGPLGLAALFGETKKLPGYKVLKKRYLKSATNCSLPLRMGPLKTIDGSMVEIAHDLEIPVFVHRVRDKADVDRAARIGAKGVMIDRLDLMDHPAVAKF